MRMNEYQADALKTKSYPDAAKVIYPLLGLIGEVGETAEKMLKAVFGEERPSEFAPVWLVLESATTAGRQSERIKKAIRDRGDLFSAVQLETLKKRVDAAFADPATRHAILKEAGDVLWYNSAFCSDLRSNLENVAQANLEKLAKRAATNNIRGSGDERGESLVLTPENATELVQILGEPKTSDFVQSRLD